MYLLGVLRKARASHFAQFAEAVTSDKLRVEQFVEDEKKNHRNGAILKMMDEK